MKDELIKSIDGLIDDLFAEEAQVIEKAMVKDEKASKETADEAKAQIPGYQDDEKRNAGRSKQISDVPKVDEDGKRAKDYDSAIAEKNEDGKKKEDDQVKPPKDMKKSELAVSISAEEWADYQAFKKSQAEAAKAEELKKAEVANADLIKSAVEAATSEIKDELKKSTEKNAEMEELIKAMANKPQRKKSVTNIEALEKSGTQSSNQPSEAEMKAVALDVSEELVKSGKISIENAIELENTGFIYEPEARRVLTAEVQKELNKRYR